MADVTGVNTTPSCIVSQNTEAVLRHKARFVNGSTYVALPLLKGLRYIIYSVISNGTYVKIGLSTNGSTLIGAPTNYFTFTKTVAPLDLSAFFSSTPFTKYVEPSATAVYLLILSDAEVTAGVVEYKV
jgi:hypothetical protein